MKLEVAGIPTATVVTDEFFGLAKVEAQTRGLHELPLIKVPHPVGSISFESLKPLAERTVERIIEALVCGNDRIGDSVQEPGTSDLEPPSVARVPAEPSRMFQYFSEKGWTDGLPVIAPTPEAVREMINACRFDKDEILSIMPPLNGVATIEKVAANAVMAGCLPAYFSVVIAAMKGVLQPGFNLDGVQTTTGNVAPLIIVNGPCRQALEINCSGNVLGQGWRANATIGRAIRLVLTNIGGATPGVYDKATLGQPAKYTFCIAENEEENPWEPLHVERGWSRETNAVSVFGCSGINSVVDMASKTAKGLLTTMSLSMMGGITSGVTSSEALIIICPEHAAILLAGGYTKGDIRQELFAKARVPYERFSDDNLEFLAKRRPRWFQKSELREIPIVDQPEDLWIIVAGGKGAKSAFIPGRTSTHMQTTAIQDGLQMTESVDCRC